MTSQAVKRALFVIPADVANGAERVTAHYAEALARVGGWEVTLRSVCSQREPSFASTLSSSGVRVEYGIYPRERIALPAFLLGLRKQRYDLVFSSILHINGLLSLAKKIGWLRAGQLVTRESNIFVDRYVGMKWYIKKIFLDMYGAQSLIIVQTEEMAAKLRPIVSRLLRENVVVIPNPIDAFDVRLKSSMPLDEWLRGKLTGRPYILWMGRFIDWKRPGLAVDVVEAVRRKTGLDIGLIMLGGGPLLNSTREYVKSKGLDEVVLTPGRREDPYAIASLCRVGISTSLGLEGFPNVILEMMAAGVPSIVTTPGADGLNMLPGVQVTDGFELNEIVENIVGILENDSNYADLYEGALAARHPDVLVKRVLNLICGIEP